MSADVQVTAAPAAADAARGSWALSLAAARANLLPGVILWIAGVAILGAWFYVPAAHAFMLRVGALKARYGFAYSMVGMALFAGAIPCFLQRLARGGTRSSWGVVLFLTGFWAIKGIEVDALYRLQSWLWGNGTDPLTLLEKVFIDQFVYCPLWAIPTMTLATQWAQHNFRRPWPRGMGVGQWLRLVLWPVLVSNWAVSVPGVVVIYMMPPALQIPIQNLVVCLFVTLLLFLTRRPEPPCGAPAGIAGGAA